MSQSLYQYYDPARKCVQDAGVPHRYNAYPLNIDFGGIYSPGVVFFRRNAKDRVFAESEFKGKFRALVFAILEKRPTAVHPTEDEGKFAPFYRVFGRWE